MLNVIWNLLQRCTERQKYIINKAQRNEFTNVISGKNISVDTPVRYVTGIEFVLPEDCPHDFVSTKNDRWEVTLQSENTSNEGLKKELGSNNSTEENWCEAYFGSVEYEVSAIDRCDGKTIHSQHFDFGIEKVDGRQSIRIGLVDSELTFHEPELRDFENSDRGTTEIASSCSFKFQENVVLEVKLNGKTVINVVFDSGEVICSSSLGWQLNTETDEIELSRTEPREKQQPPSKRFDDLDKR